MRSMLLWQVRLILVVLLGITCAHAQDQSSQPEADGAGDAITPEALHGGWRTRIDQERLTLTLDGGGSYWVGIDSPVGPILAEQGKWRLDERRIVFTAEMFVEENALLEEMLPMEFVHEVVSLDDNKLTLRQTKAKATDTFRRNQTDTLTRTEPQAKDQLLSLEQAKERFAKGERSALPPHDAQEPMVAKWWYSTDDGATWFADRADRLAPFEHDGKTAVRVYVYTCDDGKTKRVAFLEKLTDSAKKSLQRMRDGESPEDDLPTMEQIQLRGILVKPPGTGDRGWVPISDPAAAQIVTPKCPQGGKIRWVAPE